MSRTRVPILMVIAVVVGLAGGLPGAAQEPGDGVSPGVIPSAGRPMPPLPTIDGVTVRRSDGGSLEALKDPQLDSHLVLLADTAAGLRAESQALTADTPPEILPRELQGMMAARRLRLTDAGEVQVFIMVDDTSAGTRNALAAFGARIERVDDGAHIVQAQAPVESLRGMADLAGVRKVQLPQYPFVQVGSEMTEGDAVINGDDVRSTFGVDGTGVTVGVISDGVGGLAVSQASGDLPAVDTATCNVAGGDPGAAGAEGTAMLEIVHDIAPGASLMFGNFGWGTPLDFNAAVDCLAANADVVVDDVGWFGVGPYDGTSVVSANTAAALNGSGPIRAYFTAVGNMATSHYQETYLYSGYDLPIGPLPGFWGIHEFDVVPGSKGTTNALGTTPLWLNSFAVAPGYMALLVLQWNDPWGASGNDYDVLLYDYVEDEIGVCSVDAQDGGGGDDFPVEGCVVENTTGDDLFLGVVIGNRMGVAAPREFDMFLACTGCYDLGNGTALDFNTSGSSVVSQADAGGSPASVVSVGAVPHSDPGTLEQFSSLGLTEDGRLKPDVVAPDGVSVTGAGGFPSTFWGTSAAAPHVAAAAALLLEINPSLNRTALRLLLLDPAVDLGAPGPDNRYGYGRIDVLASANVATDTDLDGCIDAQELSSNAADGGQRDPNSFWDYFDTPDPQAPAGPPDYQRDRMIRIPDIVRVLLRYGEDGDPGIDPLSAPPKSGYHTAYDRTHVGPDPWDLGAPDGMIRIPDIYNVLLQYGHDCG